MLQSVCLYVYEFNSAPLRSYCVYVASGHLLCALLEVFVRAQSRVGLISLSVSLSIYLLHYSGHFLEPISRRRTIRQFQTEADKEQWQSPEIIA